MKEPISIEEMMKLSEKLYQKNAHIFTKWTPENAITKLARTV